MKSQSIVRLTALVIALSGTIIYLSICRFHPDPLRMSTCLTGGLVVLMNHPHIHDSERKGMMPLWTSSAICALSLPLPLPPAFVMLIQALVLTCLMAQMIRRRLSAVKNLFSNVSVWHSVEDLEKVFLSTAVCYLAVLTALAAHWDPVWQWLVPAASLSAFVLLYVYFRKGKYVFANHDLLSDIDHQFSGRMFPASPLRSEEEEKKLTAVLERVCRVMDEQKPYLDSKFGILDLSRLVFSNKAYVSHAINSLLRTNYKQFINSYRVAYAEALMKKNPGLQVQEVAEMAGFGNPASFNIAFKQFKGVTPGKFSREYLSSRMGRGQ